MADEGALVIVSIPSDTGGSEPVREPRTELAATGPSRVDFGSGNTTLAQFFAFWRPTCQQVAPVVHRLGAIYRSEIDFVYLDLDDPDAETFKRALGYRAQSHLFLADAEGNGLGQSLGFVKAEVLEEAFRAATN